MKNVARLMIAAFVSCPLAAGAGTSGVPDGLTRIPPVQCAGEDNLVIENRYIETSGNGIVVSGNCNLELIGSHVVAGGYGILVEENGTAEISGSTIQGRKAALRSAGNGDLYYEDSRIRGRIATSLNGEVEDGGNNTHEGVTEHVRAAAEDTITVDDWRVHAGAAALDLSAVLAELGAVADGDRLLLRVAGDVLFDFDSDAIRPGAAAELAKVAQVLRRRAAGEVVLEGHTDSVGSAEYNQTLSQARAEAVRRWLHENEGIPLRLLAARGRGEEAPVAYNTMPDGSDNPDGRAQNRRVEISFADLESGVAPQGAAVVLEPGSLSVGAGGAQVRISGAAGRPVDGSVPEGACAQFCNRWSELDDAEIECVTGALMLSGYSVYSHNACLAVDSTPGCRLCWQQLQVSEQDCTHVSRLCVARPSKR